MNAPQGMGRGEDGPRRGAQGPNAVLRRLIDAREKKRLREALRRARGEDVPTYEARL